MSGFWVKIMFLDQGFYGYVVCSALFQQNVIVMPIKSILSQKFSLTKCVSVNSGFRVCFGIRDFTSYVFGSGILGIW